MGILKRIFERIRTFLKERSESVFNILFSIGTISIVANIIIALTLPNDSLETILLNLGTTSILTSIAYVILNYSHEEVEKHIQNGIKEFDKNMLNALQAAPLVKDAEACGIVRIYESRHKNRDEILSRFFYDVDDMQDGETITIMAISLRNYLIRGGRRSYDFIKKLKNAMLERKIKVRLLLLNPMCWTAKDRAIMEEPSTVKERGYTNTFLYKESKEVMEFLMNPGDITTAEKEREELKELLSVRFYLQEPSTFIMHTEQHTFVEQYHRGVNDELETTSPCCAEYSPVLLLENNTKFAKFLESHIDNIWNSQAAIESRLTKEFFEEFERFDEKLTEYEKTLDKYNHKIDTIPDEIKLQMNEYQYFLNRRSRKNKDYIDESKNQRKNEYTFSKPFGEVFSN